MTKPIPLRDRFWEAAGRTDNPDECWLWTAGINGNGYGVLSLADRLKRVQAHRHAYELVNGPIPEGMQIDHICHVRRCCNPRHLRTVTHKQNSQNHQGPTSRSTTGVRGVQYNAARDRWLAKVQAAHYSKRRWFRTKAEAEAAVIQMRNEAYTHNDLDRSA